MDISCHENGYHVCLANGQEWHVVPTKGTESLVERLARLMELKPYKTIPIGTPKLIFTKREPNKEYKGEPTLCLDTNIQKYLPGTGWKAYDFSSFNIWLHNDAPDVIFDIRREKDCEQNTEKKVMFYSLDPIFRQAQDAGGLPFHAALVEWKERGMLLAARGNTGKSTCCRRLSPPWHALCDDETLIVCDDHQQYFAHPFPTWSDFLSGRSDRTWDVQKYYPISGIFFLERAETDKVIPLGRGEAAVFINESVKQAWQRTYKVLDSYEGRLFKRKLFDNACELARIVPAFILRVSFTGRFWEKIEEVLLELQPPTKTEEHTS